VLSLPSSCADIRRDCVGLRLRPLFEYLTGMLNLPLLCETPYPGLCFAETLLRVDVGLCEPVHTSPTRIPIWSVMVLGPCACARPPSCPMGHVIKAISTRPTIGNLSMASPPLCGAGCKAIHIWTCSAGARSFGRSAPASVLPAGLSQRADLPRKRGSASRTTRSL